MGNYTSRANFERNCEKKTNLRKELGYPPIEFVHSRSDHGIAVPKEHYAFPQKDIKSVSFKYGKYPGKMRLFAVGTFFCDLDLSKENLLEDIGGRLLLERCRFHEAWIKDSLGILVPSDFTFEFFSDNEEIPNDPQMFADGSNEVRYGGGMIGLKD